MRNFYGFEQPLSKKEHVEKVVLDVFFLEYKAVYKINNLYFVFVLSVSRSPALSVYVNA